MKCKKWKNVGCRQRMTAHECLVHPWLKGVEKVGDGEGQLRSQRHLAFRDKIRARNPNWDAYLLPIGRLADLSSLRQLQVDKYKIHDFFIGECLDVGFFSPEKYFFFEFDLNVLKYIYLPHLNDDTF